MKTSTDNNLSIHEVACPQVGLTYRCAHVGFDFLVVKGVFSSKLCFVREALTASRDPVDKKLAQGMRVDHPHCVFVVVVRVAEPVHP